MKVAPSTGYGGIGVLGGIALVVAGLAVSDLELERMLVGDSGHSLAWGPTLFRLLLVAHGLVLALGAVWWMRRARSSEKETALSTEASLIVRRKESWQTWGALALLMLLGLGLRLWRLNTDLWYDELLTLLNYVRLPLGHILSRLPDQNNHILFSLLSHASVQIFGESSWAVRLPSVLFAVMSIWALFLLGRLVIGAREGLLACALMTVSYHHIWFSQNARGYMGLLFFSLLTTWLWLEALNRGHWRWWIGYSLAVAAGMWTHLTMAFVVSAHALMYLATVLVERKSKSKNPGSQPANWRPFAALALGASLTLQLYSLALPEFLRVGLHEVSLESEWTNPWWVISETLRNLRIGFAGGIVVLGGGVMLSFGFWQMTRRHWQSGLLMLLPGFLAGATMLMLGHNLWPRFFFFSMGFALLIVIHGATMLPRVLSEHLKIRLLDQKFGARVGMVLASLMIIASAVTVPRNYAHPKQDFTGARDYVESHRGPNDVIVAVGLAGVAYKNYFAPHWSLAQSRAELEAVRRDHQDVWLVYTLPVEVRTYRPEIWQSIERDFSVVKSFPGTLGGGEVYVCRQPARAHFE